jgi:hypothetical protein
MTKMAEILNKIGRVNFKKNFTKEEFKYIEEILFADGMVNIIRKGKGHEVRIEPTANGRFITGI